MINTLVEFKAKVLELRHGFERQEKMLYGNGNRGTQQERRQAFGSFLHTESPNEPRVIEFSMGEFLPLDRVHMEKQKENIFPKGLI